MSFKGKRQIAAQKKKQVVKNPQTRGSKRKKGKTEVGKVIWQRRKSARDTNRIPRNLGGRLTSEPQGTAQIMLVLT